MRPHARIRETETPLTIFRVMGCLRVSWLRTSAGGFVGRAAAFAFALALAIGAFAFRLEQGGAHVGGRKGGGGAQADDRNRDQVHHFPWHAGSPFRLLRDNPPLVGG